MKQKAIEFMRHPLISGSTFIFIGSNLGNVFNTLFHFVASSSLSAAEYGDIASLISLVVLASMPAGALTPMVVKFAATYFAQNEEAMAKGLFKKVGVFLLTSGSVVFLLLIIFKSEIAKFFNISNPDLIVISGFTVLVAYLGTLTTSFLQGKLLFRYLSIVNFLGALIKFTVSSILIFIGIKTLGAVIGFSLGYTLPLILSFFPFGFLLKKHTKIPTISIKQLLRYGTPSAIALLALTSFISTDIMILKHFLSPTQAGQYAYLSLVGRIIFFLTGPISMVMFPIIVQRYTKGEKFDDILKLSLLVVLLPSTIITTVYFIIPEFAISIINSSNSYREMAPYLGWFGVFITLYSLLFVLTNFFLSINKTKVAYPISLFAILQGVLIWFFHTTFTQIIFISLTSASLLLITLLLYYFQLERGKK